MQTVKGNIDYFYYIRGPFSPKKIYIYHKNFELHTKTPKIYNGSLRISKDKII